MRILIISWPWALLESRFFISYNKIVYNITISFRRKDGGERVDFLEFLVECILGLSTRLHYLAKIDWKNSFFLKFSFLLRGLLAFWKAWTCCSHNYLFQSENSEKEFNCAYISWLKLVGMNWLVWILICIN